MKDDYAVIIIVNLDIANLPEVFSEMQDCSTGGATQGYLIIETAILSEKGRCRSWSMERYFRQQKKDFSKKPMKTCVVWGTFLKVSVLNVSVPLPADLIPMIIIAIS